MRNQYTSGIQRSWIRGQRSEANILTALVALIAFVAISGLLDRAALAGEDPCAQRAGLISDRMIIRTNPGVTVSDFISVLEQTNPGLTASSLESIPNRPIHFLGLDLPPWWGSDELDELEDKLKTQYTQHIGWGELLYDAIAPEGKTGSTFLDRPVQQSSFQQQYAAQKLGLDAAHQRATGRGVVVAVLDTGVDASHPLFHDRIAPGGYNFVDGNTNTNDDGDGYMVGHGTYVAGLVLLVAPEAKILPVRVLDPEGEGNLWTLAQGMFYAIDRGVRVINISIASTYKSSAVEDAVKEARSLGIIVTAAAGNCDQDNPREFPAMQSHVFGAASLDENDIKADFSNFSDKIFISAPGNMVLLPGTDDPDPAKSMISAHPSGEPGNFVYWKGTSMSAPLIAGTAALIRAQNPQWSPTQSTWNAIEEIIEFSAVDIDGLNPQYEGELGVGRIDAAAATLLGPMQPKLGDLNNDGVVSVADLLILLADWGQTHSSANLNGDGNVGVADLLILLSNWG